MLSVPASGGYAGCLPQAGSPILLFEVKMKRAQQHVFFVIYFIAALITGGCSTGVEVSPQPGIVRVTLQSDPGDTSIAILTDMHRVTINDSLDLKTFQSKVYNGDKFAIFFRTTTSYRQEDAIHNVLKLDSSGTYTTFTIYESYVPPGSYDRLQIGITASFMHLEGPPTYDISVRLPPEAPPLIDLYQPFQVFESRVTEVNVQISPFKSVSRYRDLYYFNRIVRVTGIWYR